MNVAGTVQPFSMADIRPMSLGYHDPVYDETGGSGGAGVALPVYYATPEEAAAAGGSGNMGAMLLLAALALFIFAMSEE